MQVTCPKSELCSLDSGRSLCDMFNFSSLIFKSVKLQNILLNLPRLIGARDKIESIDKQYKDLQSIPGIKDVNQEFAFR